MKINTSNINFKWSFCFLFYFFSEVILLSGQGAEGNFWLESGYFACHSHCSRFKRCFDWAWDSLKDRKKIEKETVCTLGGRSNVLLLVDIISRSRPLASVMFIICWKDTETVRPPSLIFTESIFAGPMSTTRFHRRPLNWKSGSSASVPTALRMSLSSPESWTFSFGKRCSKCISYSVRNLLFSWKKPYNKP